MGKRTIKKGRQQEEEVEECLVRASGRDLIWMQILHFAFIPQSGNEWRGDVRRERKRERKKTTAVANGCHSSDSPTGGPASGRGRLIEGDEEERLNEFVWQGGNHRVHLSIVVAEAHAAST